MKALRLLALVVGFLASPLVIVLMSWLLATLVLVMALSLVVTAFTILTPEPSWFYRGS